MSKFQLTTLLISATLLLNSATLSATDQPSYNLSQAIDYALINNPDLQVMEDRIAQAETQVGIALSSFYPTIKASLSYQYTDNPSRAFGMIIAQRRLNFSPSTDFNHPGGTDNYRPEITAHYSLFRGGQDYFQTKAAELGVEAVALEKLAARNDLIQTVSSSFYAYLAATEADKIASQSIKAVEIELKQSQHRYDAGALLRSDVLSLEVQLAETQDKKIQTANAIELAKLALKSLLGLVASEPFNINASNQWDLPTNQQSFDELLTLATNQRPEKQAADKQINIAQLQLQSTRGAYLPTADAYVSYGSDSHSLDMSSNQDNVSAGIQVNVNIFSGFRDSEKIKKAEYQLSIAKKQAKKTQLQIESAVKRAHLKLDEALARVNVTTSSITAANEALRLVSEQRKAGAATITRYIEAKTARDTSQSRHIAARFDALRAEAELNQAIGSWMY
jgi:outer membrane protein TolC